MSCFDVGAPSPDDAASHKVARIVAFAGTLLLVALISVAVFVYRDVIAGYASLGYPAIFCVCALLNCGVFGLSPSGLVAVEMSYVYDPLSVALLAGLGAATGEVTSYLLGRESSSVVSSTLLKKASSWSRVKIGLIAFLASFASGNCSDAMGLVCGRIGKCFAAYMTGVSFAKVLKMFLLVFVVKEAIDAFGLLG